jgi:LAS superfamily LD-carboxypeptidase LdcB
MQARPFTSISLFAMQTTLLLILNCIYCIPQNTYAYEAYIASSSKSLVDEMVDKIIKQNTTTSSTSSAPLPKIDELTGLKMFETLETSTTTLTIEAPMIKLWQTTGGFNTQISKGSKGTPVVMLQGLLRAYISGYKKEYISGYFGSNTSKALQEFQKMYNVTPTGSVGPKTKELLNTKYLSDLCPHHEGINRYMENLDRKTAIPSDYVPPDLVVLTKPVRTVGIVCLSDEPAKKLTSLFTDAKKAGFELVVLSGYRRYEIQELLKSWNKKNKITEDAEEAIGLAEAGHSEHQLGSTVDLSGQSLHFQGPSDSFGRTPEGRWLQDNSYKYGFIMSYPKNKEKLTGYIYEPWHFRYIGIETATKIYQDNVTIQEFLNTSTTTDPDTQPLKMTAATTTTPFTEVSQN